MIELSSQQRQAAEQGEPVRVVDTVTQQSYIVLKAEVFHHMAEGLRPPTEDEVPPIIPAMMRHSAEAYWRDLPGLLKSWRHRGKWVAYHGDERVGISRHDEDLIRECLRRGIPDSEYHLDLIEPKAHPPWHTEDIAFGLAEYEEAVPGEPGPPTQERG